MSFVQTYIHVSNRFGTTCNSVNPNYEFSLKYRIAEDPTYQAIEKISNLLSLWVLSIHDARII